MPKLAQLPRQQHNGCTVTGIRLYADGAPCRNQFSIQPAYVGVVYNGIVYSGQAIVVQPDEAGRFRVVLPPSTVLGKYTVRFETSELRIEVPDVAEAEFDRIVVPGAAP